MSGILDVMEKLICTQSPTCKQSNFVQLQSNLPRCRLFLPAQSLLDHSDLKTNHIVLYKGLADLALMLLLTRGLHHIIERLSSEFCLCKFLSIQSAIRTLFSGSKMCIFPPYSSSS